MKKDKEADKLYDDVKKLMDSAVDEKFLIVLFEQLVEEAKKRCKNRRENPIDLDEHHIQVLSIEKMIESTL